MSVSQHLSMRQRNQLATRGAARPAPYRRRRLDLEVLEDRTVMSTIYGITPGNVLIRFDSATPGTVATIGAVTGLTASGGSETIRGIDFRPRTGQLYASTVTTGSAAGSSIFTYTLNPLNAQATFVGQTAAAVTLAGDVATGYDFNPTVDRIRFVNANDENARLNPNTGARADAPTNDTPLTPAPSTSIIAEAYDRNFDRQTVSVPAPNNVIPTTLYAIDRDDSQLAIQGGINGIPSPNAGVITDLAPLGFTLNATNDGGFDISATGQAFATLTNAADNLTRLYSINLVTAPSITPVATSIGLIGNGTIEVRSIAIVPTNLEVFGSDSGPGRVRVIDTVTGALVANFRVYGSGYQGGVHVAAGDVNGDGFIDVLVAPRTGRQRVLVVDGSKLNLIAPNSQVSNSVLLARFFAYSPDFTGGVFVAAGDVNGDGRDEIIVAPRSGPHPVKVIDGAKINQVTANGSIAGSALLGTFFVYGPGFSGGITVAAGDLNLDGLYDITTGQATRGSRVRVIDGTKLALVNPNRQISPSALLAAFRAYSSSYTAGIFVAAGDLNRDARADIIIGAGLGRPPRVKVVNALSVSQTTAGQINASALLRNFLAFPSSAQGGVRVGATDDNRDGVDDLILGSGTGNTSRVRILDGLSLAQLDNFFAFAGTSGVFVGGS
jgi:hypothetical protein